MACELALLGGKPVLPKGRRLETYSSLGPEETKAVVDVMNSGVLSRFLGAWSTDFYGGPEVVAAEAEFAAHFESKYAVSFNSWTSGLTAALGAMHIEPGDEVIVSPWTMSASATAILEWNAIPVFADIDPSTFNLDPRAVERLIGPRTRAIVAPDIFGHPADIHGLRAIAEPHGIQLLSDTAQSPGALDHGQYAGTVADIGGFSLNYHKHVHCGEGGVAVTNSSDLAERMRMIRNHAEAVILERPGFPRENMIGKNYRLSEIHAAIARQQLRKLSFQVAGRQEVARTLTAALQGLSGLTLPVVRSGYSHAYYVYGMVLDSKELGIPRRRIVEALKAEGLDLVFEGYQALHRLPIFRERLAYGSGGYPWSGAPEPIRLEPPSCPVAESMHDEAFLGISMCKYELGSDDLAIVISAFHKVWEHLDALA